MWEVLALRSSLHILRRRLEKDPHVLAQWQSSPISGITQEVELTDEEFFYRLYTSMTLFPGESRSFGYRHKNLFESVIEGVMDLVHVSHQIVYSTLII